MKSREKTKKTLLALLLSLSMIVTYLPASMISYATDEGEAFEAEEVKQAEESKAVKNGTVLAFTSDVHNMHANNLGANRTDIWIDRMIELYGGIDVMAFGGDMGDASDGTNFWTNSQAVMDAVDGDTLGIYTTGNHEYNPGNFSSGNNITTQQYLINQEAIEGDDYRIYCLGSNSSSSSYASQVSSLRSYLNSVDNKKPIFIITHFPLHYYSSYRTTTAAGDIIDVLNAAANGGKKIVFIWGHNHTEAPGETHYDEIFAPGYEMQCTSNAGSKKTIHFYYAAAGCMSGSEYSKSETRGSAAVLGKGLIVTISSGNLLSFTYYNENGDDVTEGGAYVETPVTGVTVEPSAATIEARKTIQLAATVTPPKATNKNITWSSSDTSVATVSEKGKVKGIAEGAATITATTADGGFTAACEVTVTPSTVIEKHYVIVVDGFALSINRSSNTAQGDSSNYRYTGLAGVPYTDEGDPDESISWIIEETDGGYYIQDLEGNYLNATYGKSGNITTGNLKLDDTPDVWVPDGTLEGWMIDGSMLKSTNASATSTSAKYLGYENNKNLYTIRSSGNADKSTLVDPTVTVEERYVETDTLEDGKEYIVAVTKDDGSVYAVANVSGSASGNTGSTDLLIVPVSGQETAYIETDDTGVAWKYTGSNQYMTNSTRYLNYDSGTYVPSTSGSGCAISYSGGKLQIGSGHYLAFSEGAFGTTATQSDGANVRIFEKTAVIVPCRHAFGDWTQTKVPTCIEKGVETRSCSKCGENKVRGVAELGHDYQTVEGSAIAETCTVDGKEADQKCSRCDDIVIGAVIPAPGHNEETVPGVEATCTETGLTDGKRCTVCNEVLVEQETIPAKGHIEVTDAAVEPTCTEEGKTEGSHCSVCNEVFVAQTTIPATGHTTVTDAAVEPTCTEKGKTEGSHCSVCGEILEAQQDVAAFGHDYGDWETTIAPTCTEAGEETRECSRCGATETRVIAKLGHDYKDVVTEPTCTEGGYTTHTCSRCNDSYVDTQVKALGHDYGDWETTIAPTCTETGEEERECSRCHTTETRPVEALGHDYGEWITTNAPSCTEAGEEARECSRCDAAETRAVEALGHEYEEVADSAIAPTCTTAGKKANKKCSRCDDVITGAEIAALGHEDEAIPAVAPTCTETGLTEGKKCARCGETLVAQEAVAALGHDWDKGVVTKEPTCTEKGVKTFTCSRCGETRTEAIDATGHIWNKDYTVDTPATCTAEGSESIHCSVCDAIDESTVTVIPKTDHKYGDWETTIEPTCTEGGSRKKVCQDCGDTVEEQIPATGHSYSEEFTVDTEATCTTAGSKSKHCVVCGEIDESSVTSIPALDHDWGDGVVTKEPTCTEEGVKTFTCSRCDETMTEAIDATGHKWNDDYTVDTPATCTAEGSKSIHCSKCGVANESTVTVIPKTDHKYGDWETTKEPTCTETGSHKKVCQDCGDTVEEQIPATGHSYSGEFTVDKEPTCTVAGSKSKHCTVCGETDKSSVTTIEALDHDWDNGVVAKEPTCIEEGVKTFTCSRCDKTRTEAIDATGHQWNDDYTVDTPATHSMTGFESIHCAVCNMIKPGSEREIPIIEHIFGEWEITKEATCTEDGSKKRICSDADCGYVETVTIPAIGHIWNETYTVDTPATCTAEGSESIHCSKCGATDESTVTVIPKTDHKYGEWETTKEPTCTEVGSHKKICQDCGDTVEEQIPATGHSYSEEFAVDAEATCTTAGSKSKHCDVCGEIDESSVTSIPALGHDWDNGKVTKEPTCIEEGVKTFTCSRCKETMTEVIDATGHKWNDDYTVDTPATCTAEGSKSIHCSKCGVANESTVTVIPKTDHKYGDWETTKEPTCTEAGSHKKVCQDCGNTVEEKIPALDHDWGDGVVTKEPKCKEDGVKTFTCSRCDKTRTEAIDATGHIWNKTYTVDAPATCAAEGSESIHCSKCDAVDESTITVIPKIDHRYGDWETTKAPTCTETGSRQKVCADCNDKVTEEIPATDHKWNSDYTVDKEATHSETGTMSIHCSVCDVIKEGSAIEIPIVEHEYGDWEITKKATCTEDGSKKRTCTDEGCGYIETVTIPATGHSYSDEFTVDTKPTCTKEGSESRHCEACGEKDESSVRSISATGHKYGDWQLVKEATVDEEGSRKRVCSECGDTETQAIEKLDAQAVANAAIAEAAEAAKAAEKAAKEAAEAQAEADEAAEAAEKAAKEADEAVKTPGEAAVAAAEKARAAAKVSQSTAAKAKAAAAKAKAASDKACETAEKARAASDKAVEEAEKAVTSAKTEDEKATAEEAKKAAVEAAKEAAEAVGTASKTAESAEKAVNEANDAGKEADKAFETADRTVENAKKAASEANDADKEDPAKDDSEESKTNNEESDADHIGTPVITLSNTDLAYKYKVKKVKKKKKAVATEQKPEVTVTLNGKTISADNYTLTWSNENSSAIGEYSVKATLKGQYSGEAKAKYRIVPKSVSIKKLAKGKKKFTVTWKKLSKNDIKYKVITGYQIRYATNADFSNEKIVKAGSLKSAKKAIGKLGAKKTYYVQLRTYKTVGGKAYYSAWSKTKTITTK